MKIEADLSGAWELKPVGHFGGEYGKGEWLTQQVPAHWRELKQLENHSGRVVYRKRFSFSPQKDCRYWLRLNGIFYYTAAYLNGIRLGANQGYFFPAIFEVTESIKDENELVLEVLCEYEEGKINKRQVLGVFHHWDCLYRDWCPGGIWQPVEILSTGKVALFDPMFQTLFISPRAAGIKGELNFQSAEREDFEFKLSLTPENHDGPGLEKTWSMSKSAGLANHQYFFELKEPRLWSTWDRGPASLYRLKLCVQPSGGSAASDIYETMLGVRTLELRDYIMLLNGQKLFLRGSNYAPGDYRLASMNPERYEKDISLAIDAHLNILRVHAHVEKAEFYEAADKAGILIWQDFPLQWGYDKKILPEAMHQSGKMIKHLFNHPSVAIWCMHNEPLKMYDTRKKPSLIDWARFGYSIFIRSWNRDVMDKKLLRLARQLDPHRPSLQCSGEKGLFAKDHGDAHLYFGWYFGPLHWLNRSFRKKPESLKLVTEFGTQSFPNQESAVKFMPDRLERIDWKELEKKYLAQPFFLNRYIPTKKFSDLNSYIQATQDWQSEVDRYYIDRLRALKYQPAGGAIHFVFNDANPAVTWSVIDYWRVPKSSYFELKKAFSPVYAFALIDLPKYKLNSKLKVPIYVVNDLAHEVDAKLSAKLIAPDSTEVFSQDFELKLAPDCPALELAKPEIDLQWAGLYKLSLTLSWQDKELQNLYTFKVD
jgi:beta-mannosidase